MPMLGKKSEEEKAAANALREQQRQEVKERQEQRRQEVEERKGKQRQEADERKRAEADPIEKAKRAFFQTPAGEARLAYERGDQVFQYSFDVVSHKAIIVAMVGSSRRKGPTTPLRS